MNRRLPLHRAPHPLEIILRRCAPVLLVLGLLIAGCVQRVGRASSRAVGVPATTTVIYTWIIPSPNDARYLPVERSELYSGPDLHHLELLATFHYPSVVTGPALTNSFTNVSNHPAFYIGRRDYDWSGRLINYKS
jgi:hypothetical protein